MIGLSVSRCVRDIAKGDVSIDDVDKIIARTLCETPADWDEVLLDYRSRYWSENPDKAEEIARKLIAAEKVTQPRVDGDPIPNVKDGRPHWVNSEAEIEWVPYSLF